MKNVALRHWVINAFVVFISFAIFNCKKDDVQPPSSLNFASSSGTVNENDAGGIVVQIPSSAQTPGSGTITIKIKPDSAVYGTNFTTVPAAANNLITINVSKGESAESFTVLPMNNNLFTGNFHIVFAIDTVSGSVKKGTDLNYTLTIVDDEKPSVANFDASLHGDAKAAGYLKFRQPVDDKLIIYLDTWVKNLEPNTEYSLQRAVDTNLDLNCTSTSWLTLGAGLQVLSIMTDKTGTGKAELWRDVSMFPVGTAFDIHFQIIKTSTSAVVLSSDCFRYAVSQ
jgi:hypothetical protein